MSRKFIKAEHNLEMELETDGGFWFTLLFSFPVLQSRTSLAKAQKILLQVLVFLNKKRKQFL